MSDTSSLPPDLAPTPLYNLHRLLGARMMGLAGYQMPLNYHSGIVAEHLHTRQKTGLFDISHMGQSILEGKDAAFWLETIVPGDILSLKPGEMRYTQFLDENGRILDDLMVSRLPDGAQGERLLLIVNAAGKAEDFIRVASALPGLTLTRRESHALLSLQGPRSARSLAKLLPAVIDMPFLTVGEFIYRGAELLVSRSGYTGEDGFEISLPAEIAQTFGFELLLLDEVSPIGLGAYDSLRLEAGICLSDRDLDLAVNPVEAGLAWSISRRRRRCGRFVGADEVRNSLANGPARRRVGLVIEGGTAAHEGTEISTSEGTPIGCLTSGSFAPSLGQAIGTGLVTASHAWIGNELRINMRDRKLTARITPMPFTPHRFYRGCL